MARDVPTIQRSADLATEFGLNLATRWFGQEAIDSLPLRTVGKNKGAPKGVLCWLATTAAGYHVCAGRGVAANTTVRAWIAPSGMAPQSAALAGRWMGRVQSLCGSRDVLTEAYRKQDAEERAADKARFEALA